MTNVSRTDPPSQLALFLLFVSREYRFIGRALLGSVCEDLYGSVCVFVINRRIADRRSFNTEGFLLAS